MILAEVFAIRDEEDLSSGNGNFAELYENVEEKQEKGEMPEDTLSALPVSASGLVSDTMWL